MVETVQVGTAGNGAQVAPKKERVVEKVTMTDGREVEFSGAAGAPKAQRIKKDFLVSGKSIDDCSAEELQTAPLKDCGLRIDFRNGTTRYYPVNPALGIRYVGHGESQKYGDELAGEDAPDLDDWAATTDRLHERVMAGEWTQARIGGGMAGTSVLMLALIEFTGRTADEVRNHIKDWTPQQKQALRNDADIKPIVDRIEKEKAAKITNVDTGALKASLRGLAA